LSSGRDPGLAVMVPIAGAVLRALRHPPARFDIKNVIFAPEVVARIVAARCALLI